MECLNTSIGKVFEKVLDFTVVPVGRHLGYVLFYRNNIKELKKEAKKLKATRNDVEGLAGASRNNNEVIKETVQDWMCSVDEITEQAERFFEKEIDANTTCSYRSCPNICLRYKLSKEANRMAIEVGELNTQGKFDKVSTHQKLPECIRQSSMVKEVFQSRVSTMNEIIEALVDPAVGAVGLHGLGGVGKTTLAKEVAKKAQAKKLFDKVLLVEVKHNPIREIQNQIADGLGLHFVIQSELMRANQLRERLQQEKSLLVVLDDLWERLDFQLVGIPSVDKANTQCRFIFTSRNIGLLSSEMNCKRNIRVGLLSEEEAWALFKEMAEIDEHSDHPDLIFKATEVCQKCAQLPVAIVAVARALRNNKRLADWKDALQQLNSYASQNISGEAYSSIKLSYARLKSKELKSTFLLSVMFSQDPSINDLLIYAVGLGLLEGVHNMEAARDRLDALVHQLKDSSLLLDSYSEDRCTIHDVVRDVALSIAFEEQHALVKRLEKIDDWPNEYKPESCTAICLYGVEIDGLPLGLCGPKVEFFYLSSQNPKLNIPNNFFNGMKEVKVLSLTNMTILSLPPSISRLYKLKTLSLHFCQLENIALVGHLTELKILDLSDSSIKQLPREVGQLDCLKILNLSYCYQLEVIPPNILFNLEKLEELYMRHSFNQWEAEGLREGKERASLDELKHLRKLSALEIDILDASVLPKDLFLENSLKRYRISIGRYSRFYDCEFSKGLILEANKLNKEYGVFKLFESVEDLILGGFNGIASLYECHNTVRTFCKLQAIKVSNCDQLKSLFLVSMVGKRPRLKRIEVSACKALEEIVRFVEENVENGSAMDVIEFPELHSLELKDLPSLTGFCLNKKVKFPNLETLILESINCQNIWDTFRSKSCRTHCHILAQAFCRLQTIEVSNCEQLKSLFSVSMIAELSKLERLKVSRCKSLEEIVTFVDKDNVENELGINVTEFLQLGAVELNDLPALTGFCFSKKVAFPNLKTLSLASVNCHNMWEIPTSTTNTRTQFSDIVESSQMRIESNDPLLHRSFSNLKTLKVEKCDFLLKLIPFHVLKSLSNLEELEIRNCASLEVIFNFGELNNYEERLTFLLKTLYLSDLPELKIVGKKGFQTIVNFQCLHTLEIRDCNKLEIFTAVDEKVFPKLGVLALNDRHAKMLWNGNFQTCNFFNVKVLSLSSVYDKAATFPYDLFFGFPKLEELCVRYSSFSVLFSCLKRPFDNDTRKATLIRRLELTNMNKLKHIWEGKCQLGHVLQNLKILEVFCCRRLINLGPTLVSLENLTELNVMFCDQLINLLTSSTAKTLKQLSKLEIGYCSKMEEIIATGEEDGENNIDFQKLKTLKLERLESCKNFSSHNYTFNFPLLDEVIIKVCPKFRKFCPGILTTPLLQGVNVENDDVHWESNLNNTIQQLFDEKGPLFGDLDVKIDEYPELIDIWNGKAAPLHSLNSLTSLVMNKCGFLSNHAIPSYVLIALVNLKKLQVSNCDSAEVIFDLEAIDIDKEAHKLQAIPLVDLNLKHLPNLKNVWNKDPHTIHCFQHLCNVSAKECESLRSIFPASIAKGLTNLRELRIESCGVEVIVAEDQTPSPTTHFVFPQLWWLYLIKLPHLKNFYPQRHTIEWPQLWTLVVRQCEKVKVYSWEDPKLSEKEVEIQYPLLLSEKVVLRLGKIVLNQNHVKMIQEDQFQHDLFNRVSCLGLDSFNEGEQLVFPYTFLERFPQLTELEVSHSSFMDIFPCQGPPSDPIEKVPMLTSLTLTHLHQLQNIWNEDSQIHPVLQTLESLYVDHCSRLRKLAPSYASFDNIQQLKVSGCNGLGYLFTTLIAKSLVHLESLKIKDCKMMEEIVINEGKDVEDTIVFKKLWFMKLIDLPILKNFCNSTCAFEFPSLSNLTVKGCLEMKIFCPGVLVTPLLEDVKVEENEECWEENLNKTLEQLFLKKEGQNSLKG